MSGAGEERAAGLGDGHLPKDLELGGGEVSCSQGLSIIKGRRFPLLLLNASTL